jgi:hypothetical protein
MRGSDSDCQCVRKLALDPISTGATGRPDPIRRAAMPDKGQGFPGGTVGLLRRGHVTEISSKRRCAASIRSWLMPTLALEADRGPLDRPI